MSPDAPEDGTGDPVLEELWARALEAWEDDAPHAALLQYAMSTERLPDLAALYRSVVGDPARGARAQKKLDALAFAATQLLLATRSTKPEGVPWPVTVVAALVSLFLLGYVARLVFAH